VKLTTAARTGDTATIRQAGKAATLLEFRAGVIAPARGG